MKKILGIALSAVMVMNLAACSGGGSGTPASTTASATTAPAAQTQATAAGNQDAQNTAGGYPVDKVTLLCPSDAGGAMDQNCRMMAPYLEKHLGVPVEVTNMGGSACWIGVIDKERSAFLPDLQCSGDLGYDISCSSSRGFICAQGMDEQAKALVCQALEAAMEDPELQDAAEKAGISLAPMDEEEFTGWVTAQNDAISQIFDMLD